MRTRTESEGGVDVGQWVLFGQHSLYVPNMWRENRVIGRRSVMAKGRIETIKGSEISQREGVSKSFEAKGFAKWALREVRSLRNRGVEWRELYNLVFGGGGLCASLSIKQRAEVMTQPYFETIRDLIDDARNIAIESEDLAKIDTSSANGKISVRLPHSIHKALLTEARAEGVSLNQLCSVKLTPTLRSNVPIPIDVTPPE